MTARFIAGQTVPLIVDNNGDESYFANFGSPHAHVVRTLDASFLVSAASTIDNIENVAFSSYYFNYLEIAQYVAATITFPQRNVDRVSGGKKSSSYDRPYSGAATYVLTNHGLPYTPAFTCYDDERFTNSTYFLDYSSSFRVLQVVSTGSQIIVRENYFVWSNQLPQVTKTFNVQVFTANVQSGSITTPSNYGLYATDNRVIFGQGKFDSNRRYLYQDGNGFPIIINNALTNEAGYQLDGSGNIVRFINRFSMNQDGGVVFYRTNSPSFDYTSGMIAENMYAPGNTKRLSQP